MSGLEELPIHALWRLECRHAAPHSYTKVSDEGVAYWPSTLSCEC